MRDTAIGIVSLLAAVALAALAIRDCKRQEACVDSGGRVERYNFRTIYVTQSCGKNCTILVPQQVSDWRCAGPAERP